MFFILNIFIFDPIIRCFIACKFGVNVQLLLEISPLFMIYYLFTFYHLVSNDLRTIFNDLKMPCKENILSYFFKLCQKIYIEKYLKKLKIILNISIFEKQYLFQIICIFRYY